MIYQVDTEIWVPFTLILNTDFKSPVTGAADTNTTFTYGPVDGVLSMDWTSVVMDDTSNFDELPTPNGMYRAKLTAGQNDTTGVIGYMVENLTDNCLPYVGMIDVVTHDPAEAATTILTRIGVPATDLATILTAAAADAEIARQVLTNNWQIVNDQFIVFNDLGTLALYTFDLTDSAGNPTMTEPFARARV